MYLIGIFFPLFSLVQLKTLLTATQSQLEAARSDAQKHRAELSAVSLMLACTLFCFIKKKYQFHPHALELLAVRKTDSLIAVQLLSSCANT